ncbi:hypothetical protein VSR34_22755 [Paraburkholderia sp. JHI2823]|uniref:hypothetical protein n=1 Tax=Paraburkholderia TaxID=1822464 RepID=UPI0004096D62|nr:hypothetical protein [Paraburkholderia mimosarum]
MQVEMIAEFVALCEREQTTPEAILKCFMRDVVSVAEGRHEPGGTAVGVAQSYAWSYFMRVVHPEACYSRHGEMVRQRLR